MSQDALGLITIGFFAAALLLFWVSQKLTIRGLEKKVTDLELELRIRTEDD